VTYVYNTDGTLHKKKDAKNQETVFTYDAYKRPTIIQRGTFTGTWPSETFKPDPNQETDYAYDNATGCTNGWGRLCSVTYTGTNGSTTTGKKPEAYMYTSPHIPRRSLHQAVAGHPRLGLQHQPARHGGPFFAGGLHLG
jgi:YD repeat-containing protein